MSPSSPTSTSPRPEADTRPVEKTARHGAGLFDIRNIIGLLMTLYGVILVVTSFMTSAADKAKADGVNLNLWSGLGLLATGAALIGWALWRPIIVDETELEADKAAAAQETGNPNLPH